MEKQLTNEQWAVVFSLFAGIVDGDDPEKVVENQRDEKIRVALENLWQQHKRAEMFRFLEEQITVVSELSSSASPVFHPGQILDQRFAVLNMLGRGGMGEVYLAEDRSLMETVALKTIKRDFLKDKDIRERFLSEVQNSRRVTHLNVCRIYDLFEHDGIPFYSMEYVAGPTLAELLATGPLQHERAKWLATQIAEGLWAAHKTGILHCDFKPENIILTGSGKSERAVITDFGLARALGGTQPISSRTCVGGTFAYMAPELIKGQPNTIRTDLYAFGKVLQALLPDDKMGVGCAAPDENRRPESLEPVLRKLRGNSTRRTWIGSLIFSTVASSFYLYERFRPKVPLGSRQRVRVNGFKPDSNENSKIVRDLLVLALRQSPLLSVVADRAYLAQDHFSLISAGFALPLADLLRTAREEKANLVIDGHLSSAGKGLRLSVSVYEPIRSNLLYESKTEVANARDVVRLAELAASDLRVSAFGESDRHATYHPLEQVTSSSPEAVDYYFRAVSYYENSDAEAALALLEQAIALDPHFVLAHHYRALALTTKRMMESAQLSAEKAFANRHRVSERERNWIDSQYYNIVGAWWESAEALQKNVFLFPDEALFHRQLAFALMRLGRYSEAIPHNRRAIELDPFSQNNASELLVNLAEANQITECFEEAKQMEASGRTPRLIHRDLALAYVQAGDYARSLSESRRLGDGTAQNEPWSRLISLPGLVMSGRFVEAIQQSLGELALDAARPSSEKEESRLYMWRNSLGQLYRLKDAPELAAEQAAFLVHLRPLGCNLLHIREGCALAFDLKEASLLQSGYENLKIIAAKWPSSHSQSAVWFTQAMIKDIGEESGVDELSAKAKGMWPDPLNLFYAARWEGQSGLLQAQLASLAELERLRGKVFKHHFPGLVVLGWLEQAKCLQNMSRFEEALRMFDRVIEHWGTRQAAGNLMSQTLTNSEILKGELK